jgi:diacylglycerol kinase family enzyme
MSMAARPLVLLNPACNYGTGRRRWDRVRAGLRERLGDFDLVEFGPADSVSDLTARALDSGVRFLVAAGGDGTVNVILNALFGLKRAAEVTLGAIGLGSSNDFHKPWRKDGLIAGCPARVDLSSARPVDVIRIDYADGGTSMTRYCLLNASIGVTAEANAFFNSRSYAIRALQRVSVDAAVTAAAVRTMLGFRNINCHIGVDDAAAFELAVSNLSAIKRPNVAGSLCYDTPVALDDGRMAVNVAFGLSFFGRIAAFAALSRGRFSGRPGTVTCYGTRVEVSSGSSFAMEFDGEVVQTSRAVFTLVPKGIEVCL